MAGEHSRSEMGCFGIREGRTGDGLSPGESRIGACASPIGARWFRRLEEDGRKAL